MSACVSIDHASPEQLFAALKAKISEECKRELSEAFAQVECQRQQLEREAHALKVERERVSRLRFVHEPSGDAAHDDVHLNVGGAFKEVSPKGRSATAAALSCFHPSPASPHEAGQRVRRPQARARSPRSPVRAAKRLQLRGKAVGWHQ